MDASRAFRIEAIGRKERPMRRESDMHRLLMAIKLALISCDQALEAAGAVSEGLSPGLVDCLVAKGYLRPESVKAIDAALAALPRGGLDAACIEALTAGVDAGLIMRLVGLGFAADSKETIPCLGGAPASASEGPASADTVASGGNPPGPASSPGREPLPAIPGGKYEFRREIGRGGLGRVVEATDRDLGRDVAVKMMLHGAVSKTAVNRFLFEAKAAGRLMHPNIVPVHEIGFIKSESGESPYFTMGRIRGRDLREIIAAVARGSFDPDSPNRASCKSDIPDSYPDKGGATPSRENQFSQSAPKADYDDQNRRNPCKEFSRNRLLQIFQNVCNAMAYAHDHGVIHRDLKPANIMVGDYGEVYVVDWGLAKIVRATDSPALSLRPDSPDYSHAAPVGLNQHDAGMKYKGDHVNQKIDHVDQGRGDLPVLTLEGQVMGTPAYMPPEQAEGKIAEIDERSDIYSLGAILYEILTLKLPYEGATIAEVISKVVSGEITPPSRRINPNRPGGLEAPGDESGGVRGVVPADLDEIVLRALSKEKGGRFSSARELSDRIQLFLDGDLERERKRREAAAKIEEGRRRFAEYRRLGEEMERAEAELEALRKEIPPWSPLGEKRRFWDAQDACRSAMERRMEEFVGAETAFGHAISADPSNPDAWAGRCEMYFDRYLLAEKKKNMEEKALYFNSIERHDRDGSWLRRIAEPGRIAISTFAFDCGCLGPAGSGSASVQFSAVPDTPFRDGEILLGAAVGPDDEPVPCISPSRPGCFPGHTASCVRREVQGVRAVVRRYVEKDRRLVPGDAIVSGITPLHAAGVPPGSYLCVLSMEGFADVRLPVFVGRGGSWSQEVNLYRPSEIPPSSVYVPGGPFISEGGPGSSRAKVVRRTRDLFFGKCSVTFGEYAGFLNCLSARDPAAARAHCPREAHRAFLVEEAGTWRLPRPGEDNPLGITARMPVVGVSWFDALAYCAWISGKSGILFTLAHEFEWEKAARGVDGRLYSWGDSYDGSYANTFFSHEGGPRIREVGSFPADESPYGAMDVCGNAANWCFNSADSRPGAPLSFRGGSFDIGGEFAVITFRRGDEPGFVDRSCGFRLVARAFSPLIQA